MGEKKKKSRNYGHKKGLETVEKIISAAIDKKINYLTLFVFSTENWKRPVKEINYLLKLLDNYINKEINSLIKRNIKIKVIGNINPFPKILKKKIRNVETVTKHNKRIQINMALNYGSRQEIISAIKNIKKKSETVNENKINNDIRQITMSPNSVTYIN